jgi:ABC-type nitrate/sulfonate/bicarbonate transport system substrate-binding protein
VSQEIGTATAEARSNVRTTKIRMATGHAHAFHRASTLCAIQNGYFREEGMPDVELGATGECHLTVQALKTGNLDFGLDVLSGLVLEANSKGDPLFIVGGMLNELDYTLIGVADIKSIADLKGRKIGVIETGGGRDVPWIRMLLRKAGLDADKDVTWVKDAGYGSLDIVGPRLNRHDYDCTSLSGHYKRPELFDVIRKAGYNILAERSQTHPDGLPDRVIATTGDMLAREPGTVKGVLKAVIRGYRFGRDPKNAPAVRQIYLTNDWGKEGLGWGAFDEKLLDGMVRSARVLPPDGHVSITGLDAMIGEFKAWGRLSEGFRKEQVLRLEILGQAVAELNARFGPEGY